MHLTNAWRTELPSWSENIKKSFALIQTEEAVTVPKISEAVTTVGVKTGHLMVSKVGSYCFAIPEEFVFEILPVPPPVSPVPDSPNWLQGVFDYQGDSIGLINLGRWLNIEENLRTTQLVIVIKTRKTAKFAMLSDSVEIISEPTNLPKQLESNSELSEIPFYNIIQDDEGRNLFLMNLDELSQSIDGQALSNDWNVWRSYLSTDRDFIINSMRTSGLMQQADGDLTKFADIYYENLNVILDIENEHSFHQMVSGKPVEQLPVYCNGIVEIKGTVCILIDLAKFLGIEDSLSESDKMLIKVSSSDNEDYAIIVPSPIVAEYDLSSSSVLKLQSADSSSHYVPSAQYFIINEKVKLRINKTHLTNFIRKEISNKLARYWGTAQPIWHKSISKDFGAVVSKDIITQEITDIARSKGDISEKLIVCEIGEYLFGFQENNIIEILPEVKLISPLPDSPEWVDGIYHYLNTNIAVIDLSKWLAIKQSKEDKAILVIAESSVGRFGISCKSIYTIEKSDLQLFTSQDSRVNVPFRNIAKIGENYIFLLELDIIKDSIDGKFITENWARWREFISVSQDQFTKREIIDTKLTISEDSILASIDNTSFILPIEQVLSIRATSIPERTQVNGINLVEYDNKWVPAYSLNEAIASSKRIPSISIILQENGEIIELQADEMQIIEKGEQMIKTSTWKNILGGKNPIGLKPVHSTKSGLAFGLDPFKLSQNIFRSKTKQDTKVSEYISNIDMDPPKEIEEKGLLSEEMASIWETDTQLFLIIEDSGAKIEKHAMNVKQISNISLEVEEDTEIIPWKFNEKCPSYFYVSTLKNGHTKAIQIPSSCTLLAVKKENINSGNNITVGSETIQILKTQTKVKKIG